MTDDSSSEGTMGSSKAPFEFKSVRVTPGRSSRVVAKWEDEGWSLVDKACDRRRAKLTFGRPTSRHLARRRPRALAGAVAVALLLGTSVILQQGLVTPGALLDKAVPEQVGADVDSDHDGITDLVESSGWLNGYQQRVTSDPDRADSDFDGLPDGLEAGQLVSSRPTPVYAGLSDPRQSDTDADGIGDADELFHDMNPAERDTDHDGLEDLEEASFGSDPTRFNGDDDHWSDAEERDRGSNPLSYELTRAERVAAAEAGAKFGDCYSCALRHGLRAEQLESVSYLAGQTGSGVALYGDIRDTGYNLWKGELRKAAVSAVGLFPVLGDAAKLSATISTFAGRSDRAAGAAYEFAQRLSSDVRRRLPANLLTRRVTVPKELSGGAPDNSVYLSRATADCLGYVGISNDFVRRSRQHALGGRCFIPVQIAEKMSRGQAHAVEEACLVEAGLKTIASSFQNKRHSIDPATPYYDAAVAYGSAFLKKRQISCA